MEQLTKRLGQLDESRQQKQKSVQVKTCEHQLRTAQHAAIGLVNEKRLEKFRLAESQREQKQLDEVARGQYVERTRMDLEQDNE